jgi:hypothetical protein
MNLNKVLDDQFKSFEIIEDFLKSNLSEHHKNCIDFDSFEFSKLENNKLTFKFKSGVDTHYLVLNFTNLRKKPYDIFKDVMPEKIISNVTVSIVKNVSKK